MKLPQSIIDTMMKDRAVRTEITKANHPLFAQFYFGKYLTLAPAPFQDEMFAFTEDENLKMLGIVAFRGSGKSTIMTTSYPLWAILGKQQKKFVLLICQTKIQAKQMMMNLRQELEEGDLLKSDLGPFREESSEWGSSSLVFTQLGARIMAASTEQSIRGLRHHQHRPDLIICDDVEDLQSVKTREGRNKIYSWFKSEVIPIGDIGTKVIVIGNLLHEDSLLMRLKEDIAENRLSGIFKMYPIQDNNQHILWLGKFPNQEAIDSEEKRIGDRIAWMREYMLKIIADYDQIIHKEHIQYYDEMPSMGKLQSIRIGVDLAISKRDTADYTAMVVGWVFSDWKTQTYKVYIDNLVINRRLDFTETISICKQLNSHFKREHNPDFLVEDVAYQRAVPEVLDKNGISAEPVKVGSQDKSSRLHIASHLLKTGNVLFPRKASKEVKMLIEQLVGFGVEKHDDLADAFSLLITNVLEDPPPFVNFFYL